jgi:uncharacterized cupin superfamily protein
MYTLIDANGAVSTIHNTTEGDWSLFEYTVPPRFSGQRLRDHTATIEGVYVLSGKLTLQVDGRAVQASTGAFVPLPCGIDTVSNDGHLPATVLAVIAPNKTVRCPDRRAVVGEMAC